MSRIGVISDTHGLLRPQVFDVFSGADLILHAGDIGDPEILAQLNQIAPTEFIKGNVDTAKWAEGWPGRKLVQFENYKILLIHNIDDLNFDPAVKKPDVVISGHSHKPSIAIKDGILFLNPGSAGRRRFRLPVTVAILKIGNRIVPEIVSLLE
ncbi:MAG: metallophosphoesterase family protein [Calditrichia bacterium]